MDILKVKVNDQWVGIPAVKGDKGDIGNTGPAGPQGVQGIPGNDAHVFIRYASVQPTQDSDMKTTPDEWIGIYSGTASTAPTTYTSYTWYRFKGETGTMENTYGNTIPMSPQDATKVATAIENVKEEVDTTAPFMAKQVSGNIATFDDVVGGMPIEAKIAIEPVQDKHGYDNPWPGGAGKNLFPLPTEATTKNGVTVEPTALGEIWIHGTPNISSGSINFPLPGLTQTLVGQTATISINEKIVGIGVDTNVSGGVLTLAMAETVTKKTDVVNSIGTTSAINVRYDVGAINKKLKIQVEVGSVDTAFEPYSNICPISGFIGCEVTREGKNLFFKEMTGCLPDSSGVITGNNSYSVFVARVYAGMSYIWSGNTDIPGGGVHAFYVNEPVLGSVSYNQSRTISAENQGTTFTAPIDGYVALRTAIVDRNVQLELGSEATAYEPYTGTTYSITFPSQAGSVYGGTLTVNADGTGSLAVDRGIEIIDENSKFGRDSTSGAVFYLNKVLPMKKLLDYTDSIKCDRLITRVSHATMKNYYNNVPGISGYADGLNTYPDQNWIYLTDGVSTNSVDLCAWLANNPLTVIYPLAEPTIIPLTAPQIHSLLGQNNLWANTGSILSAQTSAEMTGATSTTAGAHGFVPAPAAGDQTKALFGDGTWKTVSVEDPDDFTGATSSTAGVHGLVPAPTIAERAKFLCGDGTWGLPDGGKLITFNLDTVTNTSGSYTHTTTLSDVTHDMKAISIEVSNPDAFNDQIHILTADGSVTLTCDDVSGTSSVTISCLFVASASPITSSEFDVLANRIGSLSSLQTTNKSSLVAATNENTQAIANKIDTSAIANNLTTTTEGKVLDARQGKTLQDNKVSNVTLSWETQTLQTSGNISADATGIVTVYGGTNGTAYVHAGTSYNVAAGAFLTRAVTSGTTMRYTGGAGSWALFYYPKITVSKS